MAMRARLRSVGTTRPVSSCERKLAERPVCLPSSTSPIDFFRRRRLMRSPICFSAMNRSVVSVSTWDFCVSSLRTTAGSVIRDSPRVLASLIAPIKTYCYITKVVRAHQTEFHRFGAPQKNLMDVQMSKDTDSVAATPGKVLMSGASGMLGAALRRQLAQRGTPVVQLVRRAPARQNELAWNPAANQAVANPEMLEGFAAAIHLSGASVAGRRWTDAYKRELFTSRVDSTRALSGLLAGLRTPPRTFIVASAIGIYGNRGDELLDESSAAGTGFLADLCCQWEDAARPAREAGIRVVHARFGVVLGRGPGALGKMLPIFRLGMGGRLGSGRQWMSWVSLDDAIAAILFALDRPELTGSVNVVSPNPVTNAEFTRALGKQLHRPAILPAPAFGLKLAFGQ